MLIRGVLADGFVYRCPRQLQRCGYWMAVDLLWESAAKAVPESGRRRCFLQKIGLLGHSVREFYGVFFIWTNTENNMTVLPLLIRRSKRLHASRRLDSMILVWWNFIFSQLRSFSFSCSNVIIYHDFMDLSRQCTIRGYLKLNKFLVL